MIRYRYAAWDGSQEPFHPAPEEVLDHLAETLLQGGDLQKALRKLIQQGMTGRQGQTMPGLEEIVQRLREMRQRLTQQYDPNSVLDNVRQRLDALLAQERHTLDARLAATRQRLADLDANTPPQVAANEARAVQEMEELVAAHQAQLDALPPDVAATVQGLQQYDFMDPQARADFAALLQELQQQTLDAMFRALQQRLQDLSTHERQRLHQMLETLNQLLAQREEGLEGDFQAFRAQYEDMFPDGVPDNLDELLQHMAHNMQAMQSLLNSMSASQRQTLEHLVQQTFGEASWQQTMADVWQHLQAYMQHEGLQGHVSLGGAESLSLHEALRLIERVHDLERLEDHLERIRWGAEPAHLDTEQVRELLGETVHGEVQALKQLAEQLQQQGYIRKSADRLTLTARGIRHIAHKAMLDIFAAMRRDHLGGHGTPRRGSTGQRLEDTQPYTYGAPFDVHLPRTVMNAVVRGAGTPPLRLVPDDFEVHSAETLSRCATVLLLDMSGSMERSHRFAAAKKVALALDALIRTQFPRDTLHLVGFFTYAQELRLEDVPYLTPKPFGFLPYMYNDMYYNPGGYLDVELDAADAMAGRIEVPQAFTNIQAGLQVASQLLMRQQAINKQIILITDGEPTAHIQAGKICLEYPPSPRTLVETLKEVKRCTRQGVTINTFMLGQDTYMARFVNDLTKINRGRAFFTAPDTIGNYILVDYLAHRRKKIA